MPITNIKFVFKRFAFTSLLALEPVLLPWFKRILAVMVILSALTAFGFWILISPGLPEGRLFNLEPLPPTLDSSTLTLLPFSALSDYASRPTPLDGTQTLRLSQ